MNDDLRAARPDPAPAAGPGPPRAASDSGPGGTARLARHVVESELENVLQSLFSVRQDLSELVGNSADRRRVESAMATMQGLIAAIRVLLAVLRAFGASGAEETGLFDRTASGFAVLRPDGEVLYMNAEVTRVVGRDHHVVATTPFAERSWADRDQMRRHLDAAYEHGHADDVFDVERGDGRTIVMRLHTERLDADGDAVLLMTHVED
jgi:PAS domain-containing protein